MKTRRTEASSGAAKPKKAGGVAKPKTARAVDVAKPDLKSLDPAAMAAFVAGLSEPPYRARQIMGWLYARDVANPCDWSNLPAALRARLAEAATVSRIDEAARTRSARDSTTKFLWKLSDGETVESVGIPEGRRLTVCFSTQVGCAMGCAFCATGLGGYVRNLTAAEIVDQVIRTAKSMGAARATNAVAMGQGEPFTNYDAVLTALRILNSPDGLGIGARHLTVSTCGVLDGIRRFSSEPEQFGLAVSLHAARQAIRDSLMPGARRWTLPRLREACADYAERTGRRLTFEYALLADVNDSKQDLEALISFCRGLLCHVNLILANPVAGAPYRRPSRALAEQFRGELMAAGIEASIRAERGADIDAACGQLRQATRGR